MEKLHSLISDTIMEAIKAKTPCRIHTNDSGVSICNYQDRIGMRTRLELYMSNFENLNEKMGLRWIYTPNEEWDFEGGSMFINWNSLKNASLQNSGGRVLICLDNVVINFLETIKK